MQARATDVAPFWMRCIITGRRWHVAIANGFQCSILPSGFSITLHIRFRQACHIVQQRPPPVPSPLSPSCVCVREREREREKKPPISLEQYLQIHQTKKKSSCKESFKQHLQVLESLTHNHLSIYSSATHPHTTKTCCKRRKNTSAQNCRKHRRTTQVEKSARGSEKNTHTKKERKNRRCAVPTVLEEGFRFLNFV